MRILFLTPQLPYPPHQGTALRNWGLVSGLGRNHQVSVLSLADPAHDLVPAPVLRAICEQVEAVHQPVRTLRRRLRDLLLTREPDMALRLESPAFREKLTDLLAEQRFDVVHIEGIELAPYLDILQRSRPRPLIVFDDHNCEYLLQKRVFMTDLNHPLRWHGAAYSFVQWRRLMRFEAQACRQADIVVAVSEADSLALQELVPESAPLIIPNGLDVSAYVPDIHPATGMGEQALVFTGKMDFRPNVDAMLWFSKQVLPLIQRDCPTAHLWIVGQRPHRRLDVLQDDPAITVTGWVEEIRPYIAGAAVYVAPLRMGGGTRLKLLEAMAMERAVVATPLGAEGFPAVDGKELLLADTPERFAQAVVRLLHDPVGRAELGKKARRFVERGYDWQVLVPHLEQEYCRDRGSGPANR